MKENESDHHNTCALDALGVYTGALCQKQEDHLLEEMLTSEKEYGQVVCVSDDEDDEVFCLGSFSP